MYVETASLSGKSCNPLSQASIPTQGQIPTERKGRSEGEKKTPDISNMKEVLVDLQKKMKMFHNIGLNFSVHEASGEVIVTVVDEDVGEVIREIPPAEVLDLAAKLEGICGLIFDRTA